MEDVQFFAPSIHGPFYRVHFFLSLAALTSLVGKAALQLAVTEKAVRRAWELNSNGKLLNLMSTLETQPFIVFQKRPDGDQAGPAKRSFDVAFISQKC